MYRRNYLGILVGWLVVFGFMALMIYVVVYCANVPLGGLLMDGLKAGMM